MGYFVVFCFYIIWYWVLKTKRTRIAPMAVTSLMGLVPKNETQQDITYSGTTGVVRKEVVLLEKKSSLAPMFSLSLKHFTISTFYLFPRLVHQLQKTDSFFIAIFAPNTVE